MADASRDVTIRQLLTSEGRLQVTDHPGSAPALVLMHGFPDDSRIYNRLVPVLSPRRAVAFDFLGYGGSDRPRPGRPTRPAIFISSGPCSTSSASRLPSWWATTPPARWPSTTP